MRTLSLFEALLIGLATSAGAAACGATSGGPGTLGADGDGGDLDLGNSSDAASDAKKRTDGSDAADAAPDSPIIECKPPPPETTVVPMKVEYCYDSFDGGVDAATCAIDCQRACTRSGPPGVLECKRLSATEVECSRYFVCGRAPEGFPVLDQARTLGELLARYATLEAAAVDAFERMVLELEAHGAPASLIARAREAADDERRHARIMTRLAKAHGELPPPKPATPTFVRSLFEIARENAVEGCVRETFGAVLAIHQARHAPDLRMRRAMSGIAADEARHAKLSWKVAEWIEPMLTRDQRAEIAIARAEAFVELETSSALPVWREGGLPDPSTTRALARSLAGLAPELADAA